MKINVEKQKNKHQISKMYFNKENILLISDNEEIKLDYKQTFFEIDITLGIDDSFQTQIMENTFTENSATDTFSSFRISKEMNNKPKITNIVLTFSYFINKYVIPIESLFDLLLCTLKEKLPFREITYKIHYDEPKTEDISKYSKYISDKLDKVIKETRDYYSTPAKLSQEKNLTNNGTEQNKHINRKLILWLAGIIVAIILLIILIK